MGENTSKLMNRIKQEYWKHIVEISSAKSSAKTKSEASYTFLNDDHEC